MNSNCTFKKDYKKILSWKNIWKFLKAIWKSRSLKDLDIKEEYE